MKKSTRPRKRGSAFTEFFKAVFLRLPNPWRMFLLALKWQAARRAAVRYKLMKKLRDTVPSVERPNFPRAGQVRTLRAARKRYCDELKTAHPELNRKSRRQLAKEIKLKTPEAPIVPVPEMPVPLSQRGANVFNWFFAHASMKESFAR